MLNKAVAPARRHQRGKANIDSLPVELLNEVVSYLQHLDLCAFARVCRRWREPGQRELHEDVTLHVPGVDLEEEEDVSLARWARSRARDKWAPRSVYIQASEGREASLGDFHTLAHPNLRRLEFDTLTDDEEGVLGSADLTGLTSLTVHRLESYFGAGRDLPYLPKPFVFHLRHFEFRLHGGRYPQLGAFLVQICTVSSSTLTSLAIHNPAGDGNIYKIAEQCTLPQLRTLKLYRAGRRTDHSGTVDSSRIASLTSTVKRLTIEAEVVPHPATLDAPNLEYISMSKFGFYGSVNKMFSKDVEYALLDVVSREGFPQLKQVDTDIGAAKDYRLTGSGLVLVEMCEAKQIALTWRGCLVHDWN